MSDFEEHPGTSSVDTADISKQITLMIRNLPEMEKRRTLEKLQPLMSSACVESSSTEVHGQVNEKRASSLTSKCSAGARECPVVVKSNSYTAVNLRQFSGTVPVPSGQVDFSTWYQATARLCKYNELSENEKLARIQNSLLSPALDIAQSALDSESPGHILQLLQNVYGNVEDPRDILNDFHTTVMTPNEKPSDYLSRLYLKLLKLKNLDILRSGDVALSLLKQFIYGCSDESLILKLRLEEKEQDPPDYGALLFAVRTEEAKRQKKNLPHRAFSCQQSTATTESEKAELIQLKKEVASLQAQLTSISPAQRYSEFGQRVTRHASSSGSARPTDGATGTSSRRKLNFCFKCGETGHVFWMCSNPHNPDLVCKRFGEGQRGKIHILGQIQNTKTLDSQSTVPHHLIGDPNEIAGSIGGITCKTLVDTGSQVSTVAEHFYDTHLSHVELHDCHNLLRVEGAGGVQIPYLGYIYTELCLEGTAPVTIPILVVKSTEYNAKVPVIIGTNYLSIVKCHRGSNVSQTVILAKQSVERVEKHLQCSKGVYGTVYAADNVTLKPGHILVLCGSVRITVPITKTISMVSAPSDAHTLTITPCVVNIDSGTRSSYVEIVNLNETEIVINKGQKIAELHQVAVEVNNDSSEGNDDFWQAIDLGYLEENVNRAELESVKHMVYKWRHIFSKDSMDLGKTSVLKHRIDLHDNIPVKERARRIPPNMIEELRNHIQQLHSMGVIEESVSPWSSPIVLVRKKSGELRMCVDYRKLNAKTVKDSYRIPTIEELIDTLGGAKWFATLDLSSGYHQVMIEDDDKEKTAFTAGPLGFWQYRRMPFGLCNAPALFQRMMERVLSGIHLKTALVYLDDIIVFGESVSELKDRLDVVFEKIHKAGLKLKAKKCSLFQQELKYLGHIVSNEGVQCDPDMLAPVREWKPPQNVKDLQRFLGFANFFRRFIKGFSCIAQPLTELLGSPTKSKKNSKATTPDMKPWSWGPAEEASFHKLKEALSSPPLLAYPDFSKPFIVRTDASTHGLGAVLCQEQGAKAGPQVIAYASRSLKPSEKHYSPYKLEFLALFWAVTVKFQDYLKGSSFTVLTDHNPLTYILTSAKLDSTGHRWLAQLSNFQFDIKYKPGRLNGDADALSRMSEDSVKAACRLEETWDGYAQCMQARVDGINVSDSVHHDEINWSEEQEKDPTCKRVKCIITNGSHVNASKEDIEVIRLLRRRKQLDLKDSILYRIVGQDRKVVVPSHLQNKLISMCHDDMGHQGRDRTHLLLSERFYWPSMLTFVGKYIASCGRCVRAKTHLPERAPLHPVVSTEPLEIVCMDYMSLETSKGGYSSILVITDHFTKFSVAVPTRNQSAKTTAKVLLDHLIYTYGIPRRLHSDQGANFESKIIKQLCKSHGIAKSRTSPYHPEGDGATERMNRTLLNMLRTLDDIGKTDWKAHLDRLMYAYNTTPHSSTGYSPYFLMFGRTPNLPVDALLPQRPCTGNYLDQLKHRLREAYKLAVQKNENARANQKRYYDLKVRGATPEVGDNVLVRKLAFNGKHKLQDKWEPDVYKVTGKENPQIPVYQVVKHDGSGKTRTLHRNHLMPLLQNLRDAPSEETKSHSTRQISISSKETTQQPIEDLDEDHDEVRCHIEENATKNNELNERADHAPNTDTESSESDNDTQKNEHIDTDSNTSDESENENDNNIVDERIDSDLEPEPNIETSDQENEHSDSDNEDSHRSIRRSTRTRRPPDRYGLAIAHQHRAYSDWKDRVAVLVHLVTVFPHKSDDLYKHITRLVIG